ncbi:hypothetical protein EUX98_g9687 [Antrodiella citrinella]|uniref:cellulase n=1 Tax=Antrodiella citrinella TaxID=2447956 RepID=A0A4S4LQE2_9APHY|nr:hypothetical protein EUX98_g9687 [Antrodiella citrinella]
MNWTGSTTCDTGSVCTELNSYYFQCLPGTATTPPPSSPPNTTSSAPSSSACPSARTKFSLFGVNESGAEFGNTVIPGVLGTDYTWPSPSSIDYFTGQGFKAFRIPFLMERMSPPATGLTGPLNQTYLSGLQTLVSYITGKGAFAIIDPHNFMIYNGATITSTSDFQAWWKTLTERGGAGGAGGACAELLAFSPEALSMSAFSYESRKQDAVGQFDHPYDEAGRCRSY